MIVESENGAKRVEKWGKLGKTFIICIKITKFAA